ncbi:DNA polymerase [Parendozoicomonas haliclonae]|uniref:DNA polymerase I n=1 Tax=Parendozoicomonas haliclonae TaxID=1960125 RepID=A0A1X7AE68_9GAMM|nr:DNA polymerase [Parendozoicomonas haliclonae]SMA33596.1 DNA polymerase I [Parendozoicomonas haliclonae]
MSFITVDVETFYRSRANKGTPGTKYSLQGMTYEEYIFDPRFKLYGVGIKIDNQPTYYVDGHDEAVAELRRLFHPGNEHTLLAHNCMFEGAVLSWLLGCEIKRALCTLQISRGLWFQARHGLEHLAKRLWPKDETMRKGKELEEVDGIPEPTPQQRKKLGGYCIQDVDLCFEAFKKMYQWFPVFEQDVLAETLDWFINPSFIVDRERVQRYQTKLLEERNAKIVAAHEQNGLGLSLEEAEKILASNPKFKAWLEDRGIEVPMIPAPTKANPQNIKPALGKGDVEFLDMMEKYTDLSAVWEARLAVQSKGELTRCARLLSHSENQKNHTISVPLNYWGAGTGRWSGTNKCNFQNFKRGSEIRKSLMAPPGMKVVVCDLSNIEGRVNAWNSQEEWKVEAFANGEDLYNVLASLIYGRPINRKLDSDKMEGFIGKVAELGLGYGMGGKTFQTTLKQGALGGPRVFFDTNTCYEIVRTYRNKNNMIARYWKQCEQIIIDMANKNLTPYYIGCIEVHHQRLKLPNGMYLTYPGLECIEDEETGTYKFQYWNGKFMKNLYGALLTENIVQALSRLVMAEMILTMSAWAKANGGRVVSSVHDEIILLMPENEAEPALKKMVEVMSTSPAWAKSLPLDAEGDIALSYGDCK